MKKNFFFAALIGCMLTVNQWANALTYTVTVPEGTEVCYFTGDINNWSPSTGKMEKVAGETNKFTITFDNATEDQGYKYLSGPGWDYEEAIDANGTGRDANRKYSDSNGIDEVLFWKSLFVPDTRTVTIEVWAPSTAYVMYIVGSFNNWSGLFTDEYQMTYVGEEEEGKVFTINITYDDPDNMEFKFVAGPDWSFEQTSSTNFKYGDIEESAPNTVSVAVYEFKAYFNPALAGNIHIKATVPSGTSQVWIQGSFIGWSWDNPHEMTKNDDGTFSYTVPFVQQIEYRLYNKADWSYPEVGEDDPTADLPNRIASFDPEEPDKINNITVWGWKTPVTAIANIIQPPLNIYSRDGLLTVEGASQVEIFNLPGQRIQSAKVSGIFTSKNLDAGVYIVRANGISHKVIVQ
jgi:hypothetical protein